MVFFCKCWDRLLLKLLRIYILKQLFLESRWIVAEYLARFQSKTVNYRSSCFRKLNFGVSVSRCGKKPCAKGKLLMTMPWPSQAVTYEKRIPSFQLGNTTTGNLFACMGYRRATTPSSTADRFRCRLVSVPAPYMHVHVRLSQPLNYKAVYIVCTDRQTGPERCLSCYEQLDSHADACPQRRWWTSWLCSQCQGRYCCSYYAASICLSSEMTA